MEANKPSEQEQEFLDAFNSVNDVKKGSIVTCTIIEVKDDEVLVNLNYKLEGKVKRSEFDKEPAIGDTIEVKVMGEGSEYITLSKSMVDRDRSQSILEDAWINQTEIKGTVKESIKGGFSVSLYGNIVFCPFSQIDVSRYTKPEDHVGKEYDFKITKKMNRDIVVSRRIIQEVKQNAEIETYLDNLKENDIVEARVKNIEHFGAFVELTEGLDGFVALVNMSWSKVIDPKKVLTRGDIKNFKILSVDKERRRVDLGLKQLEDDPWGAFVNLYKVDDVVEGEVTNIKKFGLFVRVYNGVEGLVHISDITWNNYIKNPTDFAKKGDFLECKILEMNVPERKLTLGIKQVKDNPWKDVETLYPIGRPVKCLAKRILRDFVVFELPNGLEGICDINYFDWKEKIINIDDYVKEGESVDMIVLSIDKSKQKIKLSYKHTKESPWDLFEKEYPIDSIIQGVVKTVIESGAIINLPDELTGFVHVSQIDMPRGGNISEFLTIGKEYTFVVKDINHIKNRISLSRREYIEIESKKEMKGYLSNQESTSLTFNYFDALNKKK